MPIASPYSAATAARDPASSLKASACWANASGGVAGVGPSGGGAAGGLPGPVHVNAPLREPLVPAPDGSGGEPGGWPEPLAGRPGLRTRCYSPRGLIL